MIHSASVLAYQLVLHSDLIFSFKVWGSMSSERHGIVVHHLLQTSPRLVHLLYGYCLYLNLI